MKMFATLVSLLTPDSDMSTAQVILDDETPKDGVENPEPFGFSSACPDVDDRESLTLTFDDDISRCVTLNVGSRSLRVKVSKGETVLYDNFGQRVHLQASQILIQSPKKVLVDAPNLHCTGSISADGDIGDQGGSKTMAAIRRIFNLHKNGGSTLDTERM